MSRAGGIPVVHGGEDVNVTIDPRLAAYAERLVEAGKTSSVSAVVNDALEAERQRDQKARRLWREAAERADPWRRGPGSRY